VVAFGNSPFIPGPEILGRSRENELLTNIFVGNLDIIATEQQPRELFAARGNVESIRIVKDRDTGEPRGMAFVEMTQAAEAQQLFLR
jgi:RNA recognition motif-containing protein